MHCQTNRKIASLIKLLPQAPSAEVIKALGQISASAAVVREYCRADRPAWVDTIKHLKRFPDSLGGRTATDFKSFVDSLHPPVDIEKLRRCFQ